MPFRVNCPGCKTAYSVPEESLGKKLSCKKCGQVFAVGTAKPPPAPPPAPKPLPRREPPTPVAAAPKPSAQPQKSSRLLVLALAAALLVLGGAVAGGVGAFFYFRKQPQEAPVARTTPPSTESNETKTPPTEKGQQTEEKKNPVPEPSDNSSQPTPTIPVNLPTDTATPASADKPDPPVADRAELPRAAEIGKPFKYQLSHPTEKVRMYTLHSGPKGLKMSKEGLIQWTPEAAQIGSHKLIVGVVTAKMSGANIYTVVVADPKAAKESADAILPPDLELVPAKEAVCLSVHPAKLWHDPALAPLRKLSETNKDVAAGLERLKQGSGLVPADIERAVIVFWGKQKSPGSVVLATTVKPFDRPRILGMIGEGQGEEKVGDKSVISSPKNMFSLCLLNDRTFLYGRSPEVKVFLELPRAARTAAWNEALHAALRHPVQIAVQHDIFPDDVKKETPPPLAVLNPLLDAQTTVAALDAGKALVLTVQSTFPDAEKAKQGEGAARQGLKVAAVFLNQFAAPFKNGAPGSLPPPLAKLVPVVQDAEAAVKKAIIQTKNNAIACKIALQCARWPEGLAAGAELFLAPPPPKSGPRPGPAKIPPGPPRIPPGPPKMPPAAPKTPQEAEAAIKKLGGQVQHEAFDDKKPIIEIVLLNEKLTDDDLGLFRVLGTLEKLTVLGSDISDKGLAHLAVLRKLKELSLQGKRITAEGLKQLAGLENLEELSLVGCQISDAGLECLKGLKKLQILKVSGNDLTNAGLGNLKNFTVLKSLYVLGAVKITDAGMAHLAGLKNLEELNLSGTSLTGSGLVHLKELEKLKALTLSNNRIRNGQLVLLKELKNLTKLDLSGNFGITDGGMDVLKAMSKLTEVRLISTSVTDKGVVELKKALPKAEIKR